MIIGYGEKNELFEYVKKNNLSKFVKIKDKISNSIKYCTNLMSLFFHLNLKDCLTFFGGCRSKKFIISTKCPTGPKEILLNGKGGLFFKISNYKDLSKKIILYHNNKKIQTKILATFKNLKKYDFRYNLKRYYSEVIQFL